MPSLQVYESRKIGQRSWRASGQIYFGSIEARSVTAFAYCRNKNAAPSTKTKSATTTATSPDTLYPADARCSSGNARAGGFLAAPPVSTAGNSNQVMDSYRADKKTWRARIVTTSLAIQPGISITSYVYCADGKKPAARSGGVTSATHDTPHTALSPECKRGSTPAAGGFSQDAKAPPMGHFFQFINESFKSGKRWQVSAFHVQNFPTTLNSIAYCV